MVNKGLNIDLMPVEKLPVILSVSATQDKLDVMSGSMADVAASKQKAINEYNYQISQAQIQVNELTARRDQAQKELDAITEVSVQFTVKV